MIMTTRFYLTTLLAGFSLLLGVAVPALARSVPEGKIAGSGCVTLADDQIVVTGQTLLYFVSQKKLEAPLSYNDHDIQVTHLDLPNGRNEAPNASFYLAGAVTQRFQQGWFVKVKYDKMTPDSSNPSLVVRGKGTYSYTFFTITPDYPHIGRPIEQLNKDFTSRSIYAKLLAVCER
jgi:hypothetical protein